MTQYEGALSSSSIGDADAPRPSAPTFLPCRFAPHAARLRAGGTKRVPRVAIAFAAWFSVLAGCQSDRSESGQATKAKPSPVVQWECGRGLVPPVTKNELTVSLLAERSEPLDDDVWALWFRGRLTNRTDALVPEARGTVTSSDENAVVTRDQLYFEYIPPGESVYSADLVLPSRPSCPANRCR